MVYNVWNDPEREIVEAAIVRFVDDKIGRRRVGKE